MKALILLLLATLGCAQRPIKADELGKFIRMQVDLARCPVENAQKCITGRAIYEHGYVDYRRDGSVAGIGR